MMLRTRPVVAVLACLLSWSGIQAAEMLVGDSSMRPGGHADVIVSGKIHSERTFGWTIMLELIPREGGKGTVTFTEAPRRPVGRRPGVVIEKTRRGDQFVRIGTIQHPGVDIRQLGDVWPEMGTFTAYDTQQTGSSLLNGAVDDNGTYLPSDVTYSGTLALFPVVVSRDARGVWDVLLSTSVGDSGWEGITTELISGTITVSRDAYSRSRNSDPCTVDDCREETHTYAVNSGNCRGVETSRSDRRNRQRTGVAD